MQDHCVCPGTHEMTIVGYLPPLPKSPAPPMAPIKPFDILELALAKGRSMESGKRLRYERSPSSSPRGAVDENLFGLLPDELLERIFGHCHLFDRIQLSHVCYRFHYLLTSGTSAISDLSLLNISERSVWTSKAINCTKSRLSPIDLSDRFVMDTVLKHCRVIESVNVWYETLSFVEDVYYSLNKHRVKFRKIAIYPHCKVLMKSNAYIETFIADKEVD
uniref:F-box domain-containing protein n=1 Tax=Steinernema glaseri TaxID=37863 RepID=A0A1I8ADD5_9BILA